VLETFLLVFSYLSEALHNLNPPAKE
jgi:hypothetical protein